MRRVVVCANHRERGQALERRMSHLAVSQSCFGSGASFLLLPSQVQLGTEEKKPGINKHDFSRLYSKVQSSYNKLFDAFHFKSKIVILFLIIVSFFGSIMD